MMTTQQQKYLSLGQRITLKSSIWLIKNFLKYSLRDEVKKQVSKEQAQFLVALMDIQRPLEQTISGNEAYNTRKEMIKNGLKIYGSDIDLFKKVFVEKSREDLMLISRTYNELNKRSLYDAIRRKLQAKQKIIKKGFFLRS